MPIQPSMPQEPANNATPDVMLPWFAGLFEGEGSFAFVHGRPHAMTISMTDLDVLERVQKTFGGTITPLKKRREHWKDAWRWNLYGSESVALAKAVEPFLLSRRAQRCREYVENFSTLEARRETEGALLRSRIQKALALRESGASHSEIAEQLGVERSFVSHLLGKRYRDVRLAL